MVSTWLTQLTVYFEITWLTFPILKLTLHKLEAEPCCMISLYLSVTDKTVPPMEKKPQSWGGVASGGFNEWDQKPYTLCLCAFTNCACGCVVECRVCIRVCNCVYVFVWVCNIAGICTLVIHLSKTSYTHIQTDTDKNTNAHTWTHMHCTAIWNSGSD